MNDHIFEQLLTFLGCMAVLGSGVRLASLYLRRPRPEALPSRELAAMQSRLERIEQIVESTAVEVERVAEAQRFTAHILAGQSPSAALKPARSITPH